MEIEPVTLTGKLVRLEPLQMQHAAALYEISQDPSLWNYRFVRQPASLADMKKLTAEALQEQEEGICLPFVIIDLTSGLPLGETRYHRVDVSNRGIEIGATWITPAAQRTGVNTECKYLLLCHAFESCGAIRVQLKTHIKNLKSQQAIERLGALKEGVLRNHIIMPDGSYRHSVYYSIIDSEWPQVKARLAEKMER